MPIPILYLLIILIWGSSWIAITYQYGIVSEELSVAYRFLIASMALFAYAFFKGDKLQIKLSYYPMIFLMGSTMFCLNYLFTYYGMNYVVSGLAAVLFSLIVIFNALFERLFFAKKIERRILVAAIIGIIGIVFLFWPELKNLQKSNQSIIGGLWLFAAVIIASLGNMTAIINTNKDLSIVIINAHAMLCGSILSFMIGLVLKRPIIFEFTSSYIISLLYLSIAASAITFGCYLMLIKKIGSTRTAYITLLFPVVALVISTLIGEYQWTIYAIFGVLLILAGTYLALPKK
ncbi:DMT family transporter [Woeseiaceae bacterium]|jgi:drug/metabolite transporter (DMT)-like permease|nr:DMT family transporter [Woeseiaceae bacterium]|tara:strand:- start:407 stop:1276 length:870 start_codon:yes stop_codon:yes gene_type:complete